MPSAAESASDVSRSQNKGDGWKRLRYSSCAPKDPVYTAQKRADWQRLKQWAQEGIIRLLYLDESGFERIRALTYSYRLRGQPHRLPNPQRRGRRINALGIWKPHVRFDYGLVMGRFNPQRYRPLMHGQAGNAQPHLRETGQITGVIQDGASFHRSRERQQHWPSWQEQGLFLLFLPPQSPQMNRIEEEWLPLKRHELSAQ